MFVCTQGIVAVRASPDSQSERLTDLLLGEPFIARSEDEGLVFGSADGDGIEGFVPRDALAPGPSRPTHHIRRTFILLYDEPDLRKCTGRVLPMNALLELTGRSAVVRFPSGGPGSSSVAELRGGGWVTEQGLAPIGQFETDLRPVAESFVGAVYLPGGKTWLGCDGPGFIQTVLAACGLKIPRRRDEQLDFFRRANPIALGMTAASVVYRADACGFGFADGQAIVASVEHMQVIRTASRTGDHILDILPARHV
jgi:dipeptidyl peptidase-like protein